MQDVKKVEKVCKNSREDYMYMKVIINMGMLMAYCTEYPLPLYYIPKYGHACGILYRISSAFILYAQIYFFLGKIDVAKIMKWHIYIRTWMQALSYALPMDYVSISKLQSKLEGEANQSTVRKLVDRMEQEGYIKNTGNRRLGKQLKFHA